MKGKTVNTGLRLSPDLLRRAKAQAQREDRSTNALIKRAIEAYLHVGKDKANEAPRA